MPCRRCGLDGKLVKAHVIPEGFFVRIADGGPVPRILSNAPGQFPKRAPIGVYDEGILCESCEPLFGDWDGYAQRVLTAEGPGVPRTMPNGTVVGWELPEYRYDLLKLFFVSVLWRASVSTHWFYRRIKLGPFEASAKKLIESANPGDPDEFAVALARFDAPFGGLILDPHREKIDGINYCRFYLGGYVAYIKVDRRQRGADVFEPFILRPGQPLKIIQREFAQGQEKKVALSILDSPINRRRRLLGS